MDRIDAPKSKEEWVRHFINCQGMGAMIVEGQEITAVCEHIESLQAEIDELKGKVIQAIGWAYADCCAELDSGGDPRTMKMPDVLERAMVDLEIEKHMGNTTNDNACEWLIQHPQVDDHEVDWARAIIVEQQAEIAEIKDHMARALLKGEVIWQK